MLYLSISIANNISASEYVIPSEAVGVVERNFPDGTGKMSLPFKRQKGCVARVSNLRGSVPLVYYYLLQ